MNNRLVYIGLMDFNSCGNYCGVRMFTDSCNWSALSGRSAEPFKSCRRTGIPVERDALVAYRKGMLITQLGVDCCDKKPGDSLVRNHRVGKLPGAARLASGLDPGMNKAGICITSTLHGLSYSEAIHVMEDSTDLRNIMNFLGSKSSETSEIYTSISETSYKKRYML